VRKALVVGLNNYKGSELHGCINDAINIASLLERHADGTPNFSVKLITDESRLVTKGEIKEAINDLFFGDSDIALFYFSGHGMVTSIGGTIVTPDYRAYDEGISMNDVLNYANTSRARDKIIILDCCHSGSFGNPQGSESNLCILSEGVTVLTASRKDQYSVEVNGSGIFTALLTDALRGGAADLKGNVTPGKIYSYIDEALGPWDQRPVFKTNVSRFTNIRSTTPPIDINILRRIKDFFLSPNDIFKLDPSYEDSEPTADPKHVRVFKELQKLTSVGLVIPVGEEHMYYAAINSKACRLTPVGYHYWKLAKEKKI
jgi:hypothetical protein